MAKRFSVLLAGLLALSLSTPAHAESSDLRPFKLLTGSSVTNWTLNQLGSSEGDPNYETAGHREGNLPAQFGSSDGAKLDAYRTIALGETTQAQIDECKATEAEKIAEAQRLGQPIDLPVCPTKPITSGDLIIARLVMAITTAKELFTHPLGTLIYYYISPSA